MAIGAVTIKLARIDIGYQALRFTGFFCGGREVLPNTQGRSTVSIVGIVLSALGK